MMVYTDTFTHTSQHFFIPIASQSGSVCIVIMDRMFSMPLPVILVGDTYTIHVTRDTSIRVSLM